MIAVIDYGVGNLFSLTSSLSRIGADSVVTGDPEVIRRADKIILPGVGAFEDARRKLSESGLDKVILDEVRNGKKIFGICLGMHCAVIEFARNVLGMTDAATREMNNLTKHPVIDPMADQKGATAKGTTTRLGGYVCTLNPESKAAQAYGITSVIERHFHHNEFNNEYREAFEQAGMELVGVNPETGLVEVVEIKNHPWFVATQFHPEYQSTVLHPAPLFAAFVKAALEQAEK